MAWMRLFTTLSVLFACVSLFAQVQGDSSQNYQNEAVVVNGSSWSVEVQVIPKHPSMALQGSQFVIQPKDTIKIASYNSEGAFRSPVEMVTVKGLVSNRKGKHSTIGVLMMEKRQLTKEHRTWYYHVMPSGGGVGFGF